MGVNRRCEVNRPDVQGTAGSIGLFIMFIRLSGSVIHSVATWWPRRVNCAVLLPAAVNVSSGEVALSLDIRGPQDAPLDFLLTALFTLAQAIAARRGIHFTADKFYRIAAERCRS